MKLVTFQPPDGSATIGTLHDDQVIDLTSAGSSLPRDMISFISLGDEGLASAARVIANPLSTRHAVGAVKLLAPIPRPGKILCSGLNYRSHVEENPSAKFLEDPRFFSKVPSVVIGPDEAIRHPGEKFQVDYEVELAVVIGRLMPQRTREDAVMNHVFGYSILHDVSARWVQFKDNNETMGKNFDTFAPFGPCVVTRDEIPDPAKLQLTLRLNGKTMQDRTNEDWCFPLPRLLTWLSIAMTLEPGDVITTGTPAGIGYFRKPQVFLKPGDVCELEISQIGLLSNPVIAA